ncbi:MAG TPA: amino acid adenylation domain-containing protein, partial [Kofleriaceae bacterium]|nr:amino acid adenylation domain-containing protein [Kofleriaceae bacterium]
TDATDATDATDNTADAADAADAAALGDALAARIAAERRHVFDVARGPVARFALVPIARERHVLVVNVHHLAWDALSQRAFVAELSQRYAANGADAALSPDSPSVAALVAREHALLADAARRDALTAYWHAALADPPPPPELAERPPAPAGTHAAGTHAFALPADLAAQLRALCTDTGATLFTGLAAVLQLLVARYADTDDVIVGTAASTRPDERAAALIGCLVQPLPLRLSLRGDPTLRELVRRAHAMVAGALAHRGLPLSELVGPARAPLFDITFNLYAATPRAAAGELALAWEDLDSGRTPYALSLSIVDAGAGADADADADADTNASAGAAPARDLRGMIQFDLDRFDPDWIAAFARRYRALLEAAVASPDARTSQVARAVTLDLVTTRAAAALGIRPEDVRHAARLTPPQRELYLSHERSDALRRYLVHALPLGAVDPQRWERALALVTAREELARCRVVAYAGQLIQVVTEAVAGAPPPLALALERAEADSIDAFVQRAAKLAYDLERDPLVRHWLVRDGTGRAWAVIAWSHVLFDARSAALLFARAARAYGQLARESAPQLPSHPSFLDAADELTAAFDGADTLAFWREELSRAAPLEPHDRPGDRPGAAAPTRSRSAIIDGALRDRARALCRDLGTTEPALYRALFAIALDAVYGGNDDFVLYEIRDGRRDDQRDVIGSFHTVLPRVVSRAAIGHSLDALLEQQRQVGHRTRAHRLLSVHARRRLFDDPFQAYYNFYDFVDVDVDIDTADIAGTAGPAALETYDSFAERELHLVVEASAARLTLHLHYDERVLADDRLLERLRLLLERACAGERDLARAELLVADELALVDAPNAAPRDVPYVESVVDAFERQAALRPEAIALCAGGATLTYGEANARSNQLAHRLIARALGREARVAICLERSLDLPIAILGVLKAGHAYVPIDPDVPPDRARHILADSAAALVITSPALEPAFEPALAAGIERIILDPLDATPPSDAAPPPENPRRATAAGDLAYVIYTSGSTGLPKGVLVSHGNLIRLFRATAPWFGFGPDDVWTLFHSSAFDFSVWELFGALVYGGQLVVVPAACARSVEDFYQLVTESRVTVLNQTPSAFRQLALVDQRERAPLPALRLVILGGEALEYPALAPWVAAHGARPRLVNMYGITETTVHVTYRPIAPEDARPGQPSAIGVPIPDLQLYLLDRRGRRVPPGLPGEIHVGGAGVARGYHERPALTRERFVASRFGRLYRSGDLARAGRGGELEYLGRADQQVKIRGYRVELGEIEAALRAHPDVRDAAVIAERDAISGARLLAYAVVAALPGPPASALQAHLAARLPGYMVPAAYANLARLPLTANGKLDRAALPRASGALATSHAEPRTEIERVLCEIWREILSVPRVGIHDDFFALGGHSMLALRLIDRVRATFRAHVPLRALFAQPTVAGLAEVVAAAAPALPAAAPAPPAPAPPATTPAPAPTPTPDEIVPTVWQSLVWRSQQRDPHNAFLTVDSGMLIEGPLDIAALARAVDLVIARQPALRLRFHEHAGELRARVAPPAAGALQIVPLADLPAADPHAGPPADPRAAAIEACTQLVCEPFDLALGPVFRVALVAFGPTSYVLGFAASHILADGSSLGVWYADLAAYYNALVTATASPPAPLALSLADHLQAQRALAAGPEGARQRAYWRAALRDVEIARLPGESASTATAPRPALTFHEGATLRSSIDAQLTRRIRALAEHERVPVYVVLCTAVMATLHAGSGQERFCVASSSSQRQWPGVEQLIGFFTNPLFVIADFRGVTTWRALVQRIADAALQAFEHPDVPIAIEAPPGLTRFNLNYINATRLRPRPLHALSVLPVALADAGRRLCAYNDMILWLVEDEARIELELFYRVDLFDPAIARRFVAQVRGALDAMTAAPERAFSRGAAGTPGS